MSGGADTDLVTYADRDTPVRAFLSPFVKDGEVAIGEQDDVGFDVEILAGGSAGISSSAAASIPC